MPNRRGFVRGWRYAMSLGRPGPDLSWVTDMLAVSATVRPEEYPWLAQQGVKALLDLREEGRGDPALLAQHGIEFLHLPVREHFAPSHEQLLEGSGWVLDQLGRDRRTVVHCREGIGRSIALAGCVLMRMGYYLADALRTLRARRFGGALNAVQMRSLVEFEQYLIGEQKPA